MAAASEAMIKKQEHMRWKPIIIGVILSMLFWVPLWLWLR